MKKYNYYYCEQPIPKKQFLSVVPDNWEDDVKDGEYFYGYYSASEID